MYNYIGDNDFCSSLYWCKFALFQMLLNPWLLLLSVLPCNNDKSCDIFMRVINLNLIVIKLTFFCPLLYHLRFFFSGETNGSAAEYHHHCRRCYWFWRKKYFSRLCERRKLKSWCCVIDALLTIFIYPRLRIAFTNGVRRVIELYLQL